MWNFQKLPTLPHFYHSSLMLLINYIWLVCSNSWPTFGKQLRLQIHRDFVGACPSRGRVAGRHIGADQAESATWSWPSDQTEKEQASQENLETPVGLQEENEELRGLVRSLTFSLRKLETNRWKYLKSFDSSIFVFFFSFLSLSLSLSLFPFIPSSFSLFFFFPRVYVRTYVKTGGTQDFREIFEIKLSGARSHPC